MSKCFENLTRLDLITIALCFGGRPYSYSNHVRGLIDASSVTVENYEELLNKLSAIESKALLEHAIQLELGLIKAQDE